ncbi:MAG: glycerol-3-phosphate dehydrogenase subunit GlpB [Propionibacteriaceae bacterium]|jgi:glycerol-3-phosphate dehydrogenase subunit B|nr:glycerol-3-phosphate dehydrogenase subunit GlpB [Propionibacteriaceae bacterium]
MTDTIVVGAGLAGLAAAIRLAQGGHKVSLLTFGLGGLPLGQGSIDLLGYTHPAGSSHPTADDQAVADPWAALPGFIAAHPGHPYALLGTDTIKASLAWLAELLPDWLLPSDGVNHLVPTALGAMRPTLLIQPTMSWPSDAKSVAVIGFQQLKDFFPELMAKNLTQTAQVSAKGYLLDLPARDQEVDSSALRYANAADHPDFVSRLAAMIKATIEPADLIVLPAMLGLASLDPWRSLESTLGTRIVEAHLAPPSVPGLRLNQALTRLAQASGVRLIIGSKVIGYEGEGDCLRGVTLHQAGRDQFYGADQFVYAGGSFESGSLTVDSHGLVHESLFHLPLVGLGGDRPLIDGDYWSDQAIFKVGVATNAQLAPINPDGQIVWSNLRVVGGLLPAAVRWTEKSGDGIAVSSAFAAATDLLNQTSPKKDN